jgi:hypothetical protein
MGIAGPIRALCVLTGAAACSRTAKPAAFPEVLEESSAVAIIEQAYRDGGQVASDGREMRLASGRSLRVDVGTSGHKYGVAYLTKEDADALDSTRDLPPPMGPNDLPVVQGSGPDAEAVVLVLLSTRYAVGDARAAKRIEAAVPGQQRLRRDVRDFLTQARAHHLP